MKQRDEDNLKILNICLTQIYQDFLVRALESGENESKALDTANAYLNGDYSLYFHISLHVSKLEIRCSINDMNIFSAELISNKSQVH